MIGDAGNVRVHGVDPWTAPAGATVLLVTHAMDGGREGYIDLHVYTGKRILIVP